MSSESSKPSAHYGNAKYHWMAIKALLNYGKKELAQEIAHRWINLTKEAFDRTGVIYSDYQVSVDEDQLGPNHKMVDGKISSTIGANLALMAL